MKGTKDETKNIALQNMSESNNAVGEMFEATSTFFFLTAAKSTLQSDRRYLHDHSSYLLVRLID